MIDDSLPSKWKFAECANCMKREITSQHQGHCWLKYLKDSQCDLCWSLCYMSIVLLKQSFCLFLSFFCGHHSSSTNWDHLFIYFGIIYCIYIFWCWNPMLNGCLLVLYFSAIKAIKHNVSWSCRKVTNNKV